MGAEPLRLLCALAALCIPLGLAWLLVHLGARRKRGTPAPRRPMR